MMVKLTESTSHKGKKGGTGIEARVCREDSGNSSMWQ